MDLIDREIQRLLAVEPSPEFQARVRSRLASEPARDARRSRSLFLAAGAIAATIVAIVMLARSNSTLIDQPQALPQSSGQSLLEPTPAAASPDSAALARRSPLVHRRTKSPAVPKLSSRPVDHSSARRHATAPAAATVSAAASTDRAAEPEVLVSVGEAQALRRFLRNVGQGRVELSAVVLPPSPEDF